MSTTIIPAPADTASVKPNDALYSSRQRLCYPRHSEYVVVRYDREVQRAVLIRRMNAGDA